MIRLANHRQTGHLWQRFGLLLKG